METILVGLFVFSLICGFICYHIAGEKERNTSGWFVMGVLTNVLGVLFLITAPDNQDVLDRRGIRNRTRQRCDYCAEVINVKATKCPYCHEKIEEFKEIEF